MNLTEFTNFIIKKECKWELQQLDAFVKMVGKVYKKKELLIKHSITARGEYQVIRPFKEMLSYPMSKWETKTQAGKNLAFEKMLKGPDPLDKKYEENEYFWGCSKTIAIQKDKTKKGYKKPGQPTNKKKTITYKRKAKENDEKLNQNNSKSDSSEISITPPALKKAKKPAKKSKK